MADKAIGELNAATTITSTDLFVLEQNGTAKKLSGQTFVNDMLRYLDGHGGIQSITKVSTSGLRDTYRITFADLSTFDFVITNGAKGDKGNNAYVWIKYSSKRPTQNSDMYDTPDDWMGVYTGGSSSAPTSYTSYKWFEIKGDKGKTGDPATLATQNVAYQTSTSGTVIPSGNWYVNVPSVLPGNFLWTRTTIQFNSGSPIVLYSVSRYGIDGSGSVISVNNVSPGSNGNVQLTAANVGALSATPTIIPANADLDDYNNIGSYSCISNVNAQTLSNCPTREAFGLEVVTTGVGICQILRTYNLSAPKTFFRVFYHSYSSWFQEYTTINKPTAAEVGALSTAAGAVSTNSIADGAVSASKLANGAVSRAKLAADATYSPTRIVKTAEYAISMDDMGCTLWTNANQNFEFSLSQSTSKNMPNGTEIAVTWILGSGITIAFTGGVRIAMPGQNIILNNATLKIGERFGMVALKKIAGDNTNGDLWLVQGLAEVVT